MSNVDNSVSKEKQGSQVEHQQEQMDTLDRMVERAESK